MYRNSLCCSTLSHILFVIFMTDDDWSLWDHLDLEWNLKFSLVSTKLRKHVCCKQAWLRQLRTCTWTCMKWSAASTGDHIRGQRQTGYIKEHSAKDEKLLSSHVSSGDNIQGFLQSRIESAVMLSSLCQCPCKKVSKENDRLAKWRNPQRRVRESEDGEDYDAMHLQKKLQRVND